MPPTETLTDTPPPPPPTPTYTETATATLTPTTTAPATFSETPTFTALPTLSTLPEPLTPSLSPFPEATAELTAEALPPPFNGATPTPASTLDALDALLPYLEPVQPLLPQTSLQSTCPLPAQATYTVISDSGTAGWTRLQEAVQCAVDGHVATPFNIFITAVSIDFPAHQNITVPIRIYGRGSGQTVLRALSTTDTLFWVALGGDLELHHVTLTGGRLGVAHVNPLGGTIYLGGAIVSRGYAVRIEDSVIADNETRDGGGAIYHTFGTLTLRRTQFANNRTTVGRGSAISNTSLVNASCVRFDANSAAGGGVIHQAIQNPETIVISSSRFLGNVAGSQQPSDIYAVNSPNTSVIAQSNYWGSSNPPGAGQISQNGTIEFLPILLGDPTTPNSGAYDPACAPQPPEPIPSDMQGIINELATYGVTAVATGVPSGAPAPYNTLVAQAWTLEELQEALEGVQHIANAFRQISTRPPDVTPQAIFQNVLGPVMLIRAERDPSGKRGYCQTDNSAGVIGCWGQFVEPDNMTLIPVSNFEYTIVHEFGHVLDPRVGGIQIGNENITRFVNLMDSGVVIVDCDGRRMMGEAVALSSVPPVIDQTTVWKRGESGWGSGPARNGNTPNTPRRVTMFQQNALLVEHQYIQYYPIGTNTEYVDYQPDPIGPNGQGPAKLRRVEEAAADMFLNWVYRREVQGAVPEQVDCSSLPTWNGEGFLNRTRENGQGGVTGLDAQQQQPGEQRYVWMDSRMRVIFSLKGW